MSKPRLLGGSLHLVTVALMMITIMIKIMI